MARAGFAQQKPLCFILRYFAVKVKEKEKARIGQCDFMVKLKVVQKVS